MAFMARLLPIFLALSASCSAARAAQPVVPADVRELVPFRLLPLIHSAEVQKELKLSSQQSSKLEACFSRLDGPWFRSRILSSEKRIPEVEKLEGEFWRWARAELSTEQQKRLAQLELQSLGTRMLLRSDVAGTLKLTSAQKSKLIDLARATDAVQEKLQQATAKQQVPPELEKSLKQATEAEKRGMGSLLTPGQKQQLPSLVGKTFDMSQLKRVYPLAPEFAAGTEWFHSDPLTLQSLRGKVVIVHFYAFQCHNCHANFEIYKRWHEKWKDKGVVVIGIQSPETNQERSADAVLQAAEERSLKFPIIMDGEMKNWNAWANTMWPTVYVIDKHGYIRHWWQGELNWQGATGDKTIEEVVEAALAEK